MEFLKQIINFLNLSNILSFLGLVGVLYTICDHYKKRGGQLGVLKEQSFPLVINKTLEKDLVILYRGRKIKQVEKIKYRVFNYGDQPLKREDLYGNRFSIFVKKGEILDVKIKAKNSKEKFELKRVSSKLYELDFDYFNPDQLIELSVLSDTDAIFLECHAAGMSRIKQFSKPQVSIKDFLMTCLGLLLFCVSSYSLIQKSNKHPMEWAFLIMCVAAIIIIAFLLIWGLFSFLLFSPKREVRRYKFLDE